MNQEVLNDLYNKRILVLASEIPFQGRMENPDASATAVSKLCGSKVDVDLKMNDKADTITDFRVRVQACALGRASTSIVARNIVGITSKEFFMMHTILNTILRDEAHMTYDVLRLDITNQNWEERWEDLAVLEPVREFKNRHASVLLVFDAVNDCIKQLAKNGDD